MSHLRTFWGLFRIYVRQAFHHRKSAFTIVLSGVLRAGITIMLYAAIYKLLGHARVHNISYEVAISGIALSAVFYGFTSREVSFQINGENKSGLLEMWVNKPLSYAGLKITEVLGRSMPGVLGLVCVVILFWCSGNHFPDVDHPIIRLLIGCGLLVVGLTISVCIFAMAGLSSVFLQDSRPVNQFMDRLVSIFSGAFIPIGFFPQWFRLIGESLPTGAATYMTQIFYPDFFANLPRFVLTQLIWLVICIWALYRFDQAVMRRLTVNGG